LSALPAIVNRSSAENTAFCNLSVAANYLLADAALDGLRPKLAEFIDSVRGADLVERLASLVRALHALTVTYEAELCTMMRLALEAALDPRRKGAGARSTPHRLDQFIPGLARISRTARTADRRCGALDMPQIARGELASLARPASGNAMGSGRGKSTKSHATISKA